ncbi:MAG: DEAD/DEAH box helicase, partial [Planctomycetaceae bacterium]
MSFFGFHPVIDAWFHSRFEAPTEPQERGWPSIAAGERTLIAAPTGSGQTLAAFLACLNRLLKESLEQGLSNDVRVVYVSPLRALSNDMHRNLEVPLREISELAAVPVRDDRRIRVGLRTGDTTSSQRAAMVRRPPHILVTTPESLYLLLTASRSRATLLNVETVVVDEIHALVRDKRGSHLALSLERLDALTNKRLQRIGLSATQKPIEQTAAFLVGTQPASANSLQEGTRPLPSSLNPQPSSLPTVIDVGHQRELDLAIETPASALGAVCSHEQWAEINERLVELIDRHHSTLIFVNTRRLAERLTHQLTELLGEDAVGSHHGSLAADRRLSTERRLKSGELKAVVATASLELGIDVGYIDLVVQIGSPRAIATFLQRIGRSGHSLGLTPKGRLFALTRDELLECMALIRSVKAGRLDVVKMPTAPLDALAQQIVAEVAAEEWDTDELFALCRRAHPYRDLSREDFDDVVEYFSEGIAKSNGRSRVYLHHDHVGKRLRARKGARIAAASNAGMIPEIAQFRVVAEPDHTVVGSLDEDFAVESMAGDVFLLGNTSWRILHVRGSDVTVYDAQGAPPTIPFWRGEAPGRTLELSEEVSRLRRELEERLEHKSGVRGQGSEEVECMSSSGREPLAPIVAWLAADANASLEDAKQAVEYAASQKAAIGLLPTQERIVFERFFDETGGMQLVVHAPFGGQINRAWGLAMRKRFCRSYDFELQATADDDGFILTLGPQHSFAIETLFPMLTVQNARQLLEQAVLAVPMFELRWRWNVTRSLLVLRRRNGKKVPPALQRFRADDLLTAVFPRLTGCQEEHTGDVPIPDHPLVRQTLEDCLFEAVDVEGLNRVLERIETGDITLVARDTREPSPFSYELLNANPYAFLDGGEIQERRTRAVSTRRTLTVESVDDLGRLDLLAIEQVRAEAQPAVRDADELHDLLLSRIMLPGDDVPPDAAKRWDDWFRQLVKQ